MLNLFAFCLDSCIVNKGEKFVHALGTWECLEVAPIGSGKFWAVWCRAGLLGRSNRPQVVSCCEGGLTTLCRRSNRRWVWWAIFALCCIPVLHCCIVSEGVCSGSGGACICAGGALCGVRALVRWFALFVWAWFCLGCVEPLPLPKGSEICLLQVILLFAFLWLSIACWVFFLFVSFLFLFSCVTSCGCCQCTHQGGDWGPCVVWGPVDGRFLVWWVIDNVVRTDSWLSIAGAGCGWLVLVQVKNKRERSLPVRPPGVKTSRLRSRDPVASGVKCRPHGGMNSKMKLWTVSW
jgi:hypothetical protein